MTRTSEGTVATSAESSVRQALGPLFLPQSQEPFAVTDRGIKTSLGQGDLCPPSAAADRALFRWMLGRQLSHCAWRQVAELLTRTPRNATREEDLAEVAAWLHRCTALSIYAGGCGELLYRNVIRPDMPRAHPAPADIRTREQVRAAQSLRDVRVERDSPLDHAIRTNRLARRRIDEILAPRCDSPSVRRPAPRPSPAQQNLLDSYLLVERVAVSEREFATQAVLRTMTALFDLELDPIHRHEYEPLLAMLPDEITTVVHDMALAFNLLGRGASS